MKVAFQGRGAPATGLAEQICTIPGIERCAVEGPELTNGWGRFYDGIRDGKIMHLQQPVLDTAAATMQLRPMGGGVELPDRIKSPDDPAPLIACIMAFSAASKPGKTAKVYESAYASGADMVFV